MIPSSVVIMQLGADPLSSDELTDWEPPEYPFALVQRYLERGGIPVPRILGARPDEGWLVLEDLGDATLESVLTGLERESWDAWYDRAIDLLVRWQRLYERSPADSPVEGRELSRRLLVWEIDHYVQWGLERRLDRSLSVTEARRLRSSFAPLVDAICNVPRTLVHRDYQSRNLMVTGGDRLTIIDFQDALAGPVVYDAVALLCDSYVEVDDELRRGALERLRRAMYPGVEPAAFERWFHLVAVQRKLKDAGRFVFIDRVKGNPAFLPYVERSLSYVRRSLSRLCELDALRAELERLGGLT
jgi:hypothetical protein